jgi:hypothetical protein
MTREQLQELLSILNVHLYGLKNGSYANLEDKNKNIQMAEELIKIVEEDLKTKTL